jgi:hypothetical protein
LICPPQIPHGMSRARNSVSAVRGWWLSLWAMARPLLHICSEWASRQNGTRHTHCLISSAQEVPEFLAFQIAFRRYDRHERCDVLPCDLDITVFSGPDPPLQR